MEKLIGKTLNDRYIVTEIVGVGGMAVVYKAFDKLVNRVVSVKVLKDEFMSDAQFRRRFANESKAITMLSQNNIVDVFDVCMEGELMYIVMEYIDGVTLKEYLDKVKVLNWREASFYIKQILKAMSHAHERGIIHRDLKPHNIMLLRDGTIKVTDFGIAKLSKFDTQTITDKAIGSVHYISPEQASGDRTDEKTDIYSVGVMFYEMITGTLPFVADSAVSVALMQVQAQPKLPREINEDIPVGIEEITIKAMMKDPSIRYATSLEMFNDIIKIEQDETVSFGYLDFEEEESEDILFDDFVQDDSPTRFVDINNMSAKEAEDYEKAVKINEEEYEEEMVEESKFKSFWLPIISGVASALLVIALVVAGIIYTPEIKNGIAASKNETKKVTVSNYVGQNYETVIKENATGLKFEKVNVLSSEERGKILSQEPMEGTVVDAGSIVTFKVSTGVETVQIPDVTNKFYEIALDELFDLGITYKTKYVSSETIKENYVVRTDPKAFTEINIDTVITVYISSGSEIVTVEVPNVVKRNIDDAVSKLADVGLKVDKLFEYSDEVPKDCVISQSPQAGTKIEEGSAVEITVSLGPKPDDSTEENPNDGTEPKPGDGTEENPNDGTEPKPDDGTEENPNDGTEPKPGDGTEENPDAPTNTKPEDNTQNEGSENTGDNSGNSN